MGEFSLISHVNDKNEHSIVLWLFNIGVEKYWNGEIRSIKDDNENIIINHMEEMNLLLTRRQDVIILRKMPEQFYLNKMKNFGCEIPLILCPEIADENKTISELVLEDKRLIEQVKRIKKDHGIVYFVPYGVSWMEEEIARKCGLKLIGAPSNINMQVHNKIFARKLAESQEYLLPEGKICTGYEELEKAYHILINKYPKLILKQPYGASGKGLWFIGSLDKLRLVYHTLKRISKENNYRSIILEGWIEQRIDLSYQVYIDKNGKITTFGVKEQLLNGTVYRGSIMPPKAANKIVEECKKYGNEVGKLLYKKGYVGILGIDAILTAQNELMPLIEINARFTLSTYISFIENKYKNKCIMSYYIKQNIAANNDFRYFYQLMDLRNVWFKKEAGRGALCYVSGTLDGKAAGGHGRIFLLAIGDTYDEAAELRKKAVDIISSNDKIYNIEHKHYM